MRIKQRTERKIIPLGYLDNENAKPEKKRPLAQPKAANPPKSKRTKKPRAFPKFKVNSMAVTPPLAFVRDVFKYGFLLIPPVSVVKTSPDNPLKTRVSLALKVSQSASYFKPSQINRLHVVSPAVMVSFKRQKDTLYPKLKPHLVKTKQVEPKTKIPRRRAPTPSVQFLKPERIQKDSPTVLLPSLTKNNTLRISYTSSIPPQGLLVATMVPPDPEESGYLSIISNKMSPLKLLLSTSLPATGHPQGTPQENLTTTTSMIGGGKLILPNIGLSKGVRVNILEPKKEFNIIEPPGSVYGFIKMEVKKMEGEILLSNLLNIKGYLPKGASEALDKPIFVLIGQDIGEWHYPVAYLLSELYKEIKGEKPSPTLRDFGEYIEDAKNVDSAKEVHLMVTFKPWGKIEILDGREVEVSKIKSFFEKIRGRLGTAYLQGLGFFLVVAENKKIPDIENFLSQVKGVSKNIMLPEIPESKTLERYSALTYALLGIEDDDFLRAIEKYEEVLKKTAKVLSFFVPRGMDETQEHLFKESHQYPLKVAVFSYLIDLELKKLDERPAGDEFYKFIASLLTTGKIKIESPIRIGEREVIPDIIYNGDNKKAYIEIETLVGTEDPLKKIDMTIGKYLLDNRFVLDGHELWIVLRPVSALIHYEDLKQHQKLFKLLYGEVPVKFKVLVYRKGWRLIDIETFAKRIKDALKETKELRENV